jgi:NAD(P)H dehydrogenase (quinone)
VSGVTYGGKRFYNQGGLKGKKALLSFTLGGRDHMFGEGAIHGSIEDMLRPVLRGSLYYVGMDVLPPFIGYHVPYISQEAREQILQDYTQYLAKLDELQPLVFPTLDQFDDKLYPKQG